MYRAILITTTLLALVACGDSPEPQALAAAEPRPGGIADRDLATVHSWLKSGQPQAEPVPPTMLELPPVEDMIHGLEQRLENNPDDRKGWSLLARSYAYVGRLGDARRAAANAVMLGDDAESLERQIAAAHEGAL